MQSLAIFCGAKHGHRAAYTQAAVALGQGLAQQGITLVYGGGNIGLMGEVATAALDAGGRVVGVIPAFMVERELAHAGLSELIVVDSMHSRKARMAALAQGFIALPGGIGTYDELFEILTWAQLGIHPYPVGLLDVDGYFDPFRALWQRAKKTKAKTLILRTCCIFFMYGVFKYYKFFKACLIIDSTVAFAS